MTFEEAYEILANGEPMSAILMITDEIPAILPGGINFCGTAVFGIPTIVVGELGYDGFTLFWTADGISTEPPASNNPPT
jgi:hypothetical protein